jgi:hypothetical protein
MVCPQAMPSAVAIGMTAIAGRHENLARHLPWCAAPQSLIPANRKW